MREWYKIAVPTLMIIVSVIAAAIYCIALVYNKKSLKLQRENRIETINIKRKTYLTKMINKHFLNVRSIEKEYILNKGTSYKIAVEDKFKMIYESFHMTILSSDAIEFISVTETKFKTGFIQIKSIDYGTPASQNSLKLISLLNKYNNWIATSAFNRDEIIGAEVDQLIGCSTFNGMNLKELNQMVDIKHQPELIRKIVRYMKSNDVKIIK